MTTEFRVNIAVPAALIGDPARAAMLMSLMDGGRRAAGELAAIANLSAQAASGHLARLRDGEMVISEVDGRHRFYRLASPDVAQALEHLLALAPRTPPGTSKLTLLKPLRWAPCVDWTERRPHLARALGAAMLSTFRARGWLVPLPPGRAVALSAAGENSLRAWGLHFDIAAGTTAPLAKKPRAAKKVRG